VAKVVEAVDDKAVGSLHDAGVLDELLEVNEIAFSPDFEVKHLCGTILAEVLKVSVLAQLKETLVDHSHDVDGFTAGERIAQDFEHRVL